MTEADEFEPVVTHNQSEKRFESTVGGQLATARYERRGDQIIFTHTNVPEAYEGRGIGNALASAALEYALKENVEVVPQCAFIAAYVREHSEYQHLVRGDSQRS